MSLPMTITEALTIAAEHCQWAEKNGIRPHEVVEGIGVSRAPHKIDWFRACRLIAIAQLGMAGAA